MTRRIQGMLLILLLLAGTPIRAAEGASAPTAHVEIASITPGQLEALQGQLAAAGVRCEPTVGGGGVRLALVARSRLALESALAELGAAAAAAGVDIHVLTGAGAGLRAVPTKTISLDSPQRARPIAALPSLTRDADRLDAAARRRATEGDSPPIRAARAPSAGNTRGPPA